MTVAVGAKFPWGVLSSLIPEGAIIPESIILASDSRFSRKVGTGYQPMTDSGTKLFRIGNDVAGVYAGVSFIGEKCIETLRRNLKRQDRPNSENSREIAHHTFKQVFKHEVGAKRIPPDQASLYLIIGVCSKAGKAELYRFSYEDNFEPTPIEGLVVVGWRQTHDAFTQMLNEELHRKTEEELALRAKYPMVPMAQWAPMPIADGQVATLVVGMLNKIVEEGSDQTIGGDIQLGMITKDGVTFPNVSSTTDPTNEGPGWTPVTADRTTLRTVTGISGTLGVFHSG